MKQRYRALSLRRLLRRQSLRRIRSMRHRCHPHHLIRLRAQLPSNGQYRSSPARFPQSRNPASQLRRRKARQRWRPQLKLLPRRNLLTRPARHPCRNHCRILPCLSRKQKAWAMSQRQTRRLPLQRMQRLGQRRRQVTASDSSQARAQTHDLTRLRRGGRGRLRFVLDEPGFRGAVPRGVARARFVGTTPDGMWMLALPSHEIVVVPPPPGV